MSRTDTIRALVETLSTEGEALAYPDHPLVLDGPSLLRLVESVLTASFVYTHSSRPANSVAEQARVLLARLAYPGHTVFEAIFADDSMPDHVSLGLFDSYRVVTAQSLSQPDGDNEARTRVGSVVERLRGPHFARFAANQQGAFKDRPEGARASYTQFPLEEMPRYKFVATNPEKLTAQIPEGSRARTNSRLQRVAETFTAIDYGLGMGTSALIDVAGALRSDYYLEQHSLRANLAFDSKHTGIEASKTLRAAQFAGGLVKSTW